MHAIAVGLALAVAPAQASDLAQRLEQVRAKHGTPAIAAAIVRTGRVVDSAAVGVRSVDRPASIRVHDGFHLASCTKSMTAMLAAIAVERGLLRWNSRLDAVMPELSKRVRREFRGATLEQLLAHAAQFPAYTQFGAARLE